MSSATFSTANPRIRGESWRGRLLEAAAELTRRDGWQSLTMSKLAAEVGVSRQTVYNELGSKTALAEAMVMRELTAFLAQVDAAFTAHPTDLVAAIEQAAYDVLTMARSNPLVRAILSSSHGADSDLLPLLTTQSTPILESARTIIEGHLNSYELGFDAQRLESLVDMVVRLVLSHVTTPGTTTPAETAFQIAWISAQVLRAGSPTQ